MCLLQAWDRVKETAAAQAGKGTGGKFCGKRRKERETNGAREVSVTAIRNAGFSLSAERSGGFTKVFLIQQMTEMVISREGVERETV